MAIIGDGCVVLMSISHTNQSVLQVLAHQQAELLAVMFFCLRNEPLLIGLKRLKQWIYHFLSFLLRYYSEKNTFTPSSLISKLKVSNVRRPNQTFKLPILMHFISIIITVFVYKPFSHNKFIQIFFCILDYCS
eukprot:GFUD01003896.1.p1 GENE.GFUD01003896.1~~GFUD01003896.1.p1  ORF type:complete len:133 (-),score=7.07 GFUD01003896.1:1-399(-)